MSAFFIYLRNITYYLMFVSLIGMLAPPGKYKKFVSLVTGFILLSIMIAPLAGFSGDTSVTDWFSGIHTEGRDQDLESSYANWRGTYLRYAFETQLGFQLENLLSQNGFTVYEKSFTFPEDFSRLNSVSVVLSREETPQRVPFIRIQPVQIGIPEPAEACPTAIAAKNLISEFYNLNVEHINVEVMR